LAVFDVDATQPVVSMMAYDPVKAQGELGLRGRQPGSGDGQAAIALDSVRGVIVRNSQAAEGTTTFLRHRAVTEAGLFGNNDVTKAATAIDPLPSPFALSTSISLPTTHPHRP